MVPAMPIPIVAKREAQKVELRCGFVQVDDPRFRSIDGQTKTAFELRFDPLRQLAALIAGQHHEVVRITDDLRIGPRCRPSGR